MKIWKKGFAKLAWIGIFLWFKQSLFAQSNLTASNLTLLGAELSNTPPITVDGLPSFALFYSAQNPANPPLPGNPNQLSAWLIATNTYLLDDLDFDYAAWAQAHSQAMGRLRGGGGGGFAMDDSGGLGGYSFSTNGLWLQITNVTNGLAYLNLNNATDTVYEIMTKTDLTLTNWTIEAEVWPTNATVMPFTLEQSGRTNLFVWARDWTGVTENGNTTPDWWFWEYFGSSVFPNGNGSLSLSDSTLDSRGVNTYLFDYQNGVDPNVIGFSLAATNNYVNRVTANGQLNVVGGIPGYYAISVDDTNYASDATWQTYSGTNITAVLGLVEGWHNVWVGLRGPASHSTPTWAGKRMKVDFSPPTLVITNPVTSALSVPLVQIQGYCAEELAAISYDLSNASGLVTNQPVLVLDQFYDTNTWEFTTNAFQAFDVSLTPGTNTLTLHATDLAGNTTTTNFNLTLASDTNAPALNLVWPQPGMSLCGTNFTIFGTTDDPGATITAIVVDDYGDTNISLALMERNGNFWLEDLPLTNGVTSVTLTAMDIWSNTVTTNFNVSQSGLNLTLNAVDTNQLYLPSLTLTGTVSDATVAIWVNGIQGVNNGDGTWTATNAPVTPGGTARFYISAYPAGDALATNISPAFLNPPDPNSANLSDNTDQPSRLYVDSYNQSGNPIGGNEEDIQDSFANGTVAIDNETETYICHWRDGNGGGEASTSHNVFGSIGDPVTLDCNWSQTWSNSFYPNLPLGTVTETPISCSDDGPSSVFINWAHADVQVSQNWTFSDVSEEGPYTEIGSVNGPFTTQAKIKLYTGGKAAVNRQNLWCVTAGATEHRFACLVSHYNTPSYSFYPVPSPNVTAGAFGALGSDGNAWRTLPNNTSVDITPSVSGLSWYDFSVSTQEYKLTLTANGYGIGEHKQPPVFCVGQKVTLDSGFDTLPPLINSFNVNWKVDGEYVNSITPANGQIGPYYLTIPFLLNTPTVYVWWYDLGGLKNVDSELDITFSNGQAVKIDRQGMVFIYRPFVFDFTNESPRSFMYPTASGLSYGDPTAPPDGTNGMIWHATINSTWEGRWEITQIYQAEYHTSPGLIDVLNTLSVNAADSREAYSGTHRYSLNVPASQLVTLEDYPCCTFVGLGVDITIASSSDYIRFKPGPTDDDGNIYVTLGVVNWKAHGAYSISSGLYINNTPAATAPDNSYNFPTWTEIVTSIDP